MKNLASYETLVDLMRDRVQTHPDRIAYTFIDATGRSSDVTYGQLDTRARAVAAQLSRHVVPHDRVLQVFPAGLEFLYAFFGTLYAGAVGVPLPRPGKASEIRRLTSACRAAKATCILTTSELASELRALEDARSDQWDIMVVGAVDESQASQFRAPHLQADTLAYLQFTSGSTGLPKGVMISHANILANEEMIRLAFEHDESSTMVGWLPHSHDMGLIGNILQPLYIGSRSVLMAPTTFIRSPLRWLEAVSTYGGRTSGGPNFAFELCVQNMLRPGAHFQGDLASWQIAFVGSEPIRARTLDSFARTFEPYGFRRGALFPCYGLAEATLLVSAEQKGRGPQEHTPTTSGTARATKPHVSSGMLVPHQTVKIVDPHSRLECAEGITGEIWVAGDHVASGYWDLPRESEETFGATLVGSSQPFLRTGDLAYLQNGALHVTGRLKDVIILRGHNYYPQDIEAAAEQVGRGVRLGGGAAFPFEHGGQERIALVIEHEELASSEVEASCARLREAVIDGCGLRLDVIVLIAKNALRKTTSGKVERRAMRAAFLDGSLACIGYSSVLGENEESWDAAYRPSPTRTTRTPPPQADSSAQL